MMSEEKYVYFVLTEEGMECMSRKSAQDALVQYIELNDNSDEWIDDLLNGKTEIDSVVRMNQSEYKEWLKNAIEV